MPKFENKLLTEKITASGQSHQGIRIKTAYFGKLSTGRCKNQETRPFILVLGSWFLEQIDYLNATPEAKPREIL